MTLLLLTPNKAFCVPECEKCEARMVPKDWDNISTSKDEWKWPRCEELKLLENQ